MQGNRNKVGRDIASGQLCIRNQIGRLKSSLSEANRLVNRTGSGDTQARNLEDQVLNTCPYFKQLEPILGSTYGRDSEIVDTREAIPAEFPEAVSDNDASSEEPGSDDLESPLLPTGQQETAVLCRRID